jgi:type II secretory pathway component HofQ
MKKTSLLLIGVSTTLYASLAMAQVSKTAPAAPVERFVPLELSVQPAKEITLSMNYKDVDVIELLHKIAVEGNLAIAVRGDVEGLVEEIRLTNVSPEQALQKVVEEAGLTWKLVDQVYIVTPTTAAKPEEKATRIELSFQDVEIASLLMIVSQQFNLKVSVSPDVTGKLKLINLKNRTPQEALQTICQAGNLAWKKDGDTYFVSKPTP